MIVPLIESPVQASGKPCRKNAGRMMFDKIIEGTNVACQACVAGQKILPVWANQN
jgi:hypothetical protein